MKPLQKWFVIVMTTLTMLSLFLIGDAILMGIVAIVLSTFDKALAIEVFKNGVSVLFCAEFLLTIPAVIKSRK